MKTDSYKKRIPTTLLEPDAHIRIAGLRRLAASEWPEKDVGALPAAGGQTVSFVIAVRHDEPIRGVSVAIEIPFGEPVQAHPLGMTPFPEASVVIPDPVMEDVFADVCADRTQSFIAGVFVPPDLKPGPHTVHVRVSSASHGTSEKRFQIVVFPFRMPERPELSDSIFWMHWSQIARFYKVELWSEPFWRIAERYLRELAIGGMTGMMVCLHDDPHRYPLPPELKRFNYRPAMVGWIRRRDGSFHFDYSIYDRCIETGDKLGINREIQCLSLLPCKLQNPVLTYFDEAQGETISHETTPDSADYLRIWDAFLRDFAEHNRARGWLQRLSLVPYDEPRDGELFIKVARMARERIPGIRITAALDNSSIARQVKDVLDIATVNLEILHQNPDLLGELRALGKEAQWYNCMTPEWGNTLFASPLADAWRMPWITAAHELRGYLRWSAINWTDAPWTQPAFQWPTGDMFLLYPGKQGPASSLRWEAYKEGREDLAIFLAHRPDGDARTAERLAELGGFGPIPAPADVTEWRWQIYNSLER